MPVDDSTIFFNKVVKALRLARLGAQTAFGNQFLNGDRRAAAIVEDDLLGSVVRVDLVRAEFGTENTRCPQNRRCVGRPHQLQSVQLCVSSDAASPDNQT